MIEITLTRDLQLGQGGWHIVVLDGGRITVQMVTGIMTNAELRDRIIGAVLDAFRPSLPANTYIRATNNRHEDALIASKTIRRSINHADHTAERGLSVSRAADYAAVAGYKYAYFVRGTIIDSGGDGEPVLDLDGLEVVGPVRMANALVRKDRIKRSKLMRDRGWSRAALLEVIENRFKLD